MAGRLLDCNTQNVSMDITQLIGIGASVGTGVSLLPQLIKLMKEKQAEHLSFLTMGVLLAGLILWVIYGSLKNDPIIIISNGVSIFLNVWIMVLSIKYKKSM